MQLYIDPGTGSMLFTILIGLVSAGVYALRSALVKLKFVFSGGRQVEASHERTPIAIFSDDKRYWNVFHPICIELDNRGVTARYLTASPDDPALKCEFEHVRCEFLGEGNRAFAALNVLEADIVLSSTPGLDVYQWKRSRDVKWYAHVLHAISDVTMYRMFGIDYYDAILLSGKYQVEQVRELERLRNLPAKELPIVGISYMDAMKARWEAVEDRGEHGTTVLLAPSWGSSSIFSLYGGRIIAALLETGYHVVVRPHPQSMKSEAAMMESIMGDYPESDQLEWNFDNDNFDVLSRCDIMVSDFSGVIFDFALVFDKPVIYAAPSYDKGPYDAWWIDEDPWTFRALPKIGMELGEDSLCNMKAVIDSCLANPELQKGRDVARVESWGRQGESAKAVADYLEEKLAELSL